MRFRDAVGTKLPPKQRCVDIGIHNYWLIKLVNRIMGTFGQKWKEPEQVIKKAPEEKASNCPHNIIDFSILLTTGTKIKL